MLKESCKICLRPINNPICERCFIRQVSAWFENIGLSEFTKQIMVNKLQLNISEDGINEQGCIICGNPVDICSSCFVSKSSRLFLKLGFSPEFIQSFQAIFNYVCEEA
jgi:hypothetical protein